MGYSRLTSYQLPDDTFIALPWSLCRDADTLPYTIKGETVIAVKVPARVETRTPTHGCAYCPNDCYGTHAICDACFMDGGV